MSKNNKTFKEVRSLPKEDYCLGPIVGMRNSFVSKPLDRKPKTFTRNSWVAIEANGHTMQIALIALGITVLGLIISVISIAFSTLH